MSKSAREVIAVHFGESLDPDYDAARVISDLSAAGFVIVPKEPSEGMITAGSEAETVWWNEGTDEREACVTIFSAMLLQAEKESG